MSNEHQRINLDSPDAMFATVLERLEAIQHTCLEIKTEAKKTNGRVTALERWRDIATARVSIVAGLVGAAGSIIFWLVKIYFGHG